MIVFNQNIIPRLLSKYFEYMRQADPFLGQIQSHREIHGGGYDYQEDDKKLHTPLNENKLIAEISKEDTINFNISKLSENIYNLAIENNIQMFHSLRTTMEQVTEFTGNVVKGQISIENFLKMIEKISIEFDDSGRPRLPQILCGNEAFKEMQKQQWTPETQRRLVDILEEKKRKYYAQKCYRKLSYVN